MLQKKIMRETKMMIMGLSMMTKMRKKKRRKKKGLFLKSQRKFRKKRGCNLLRKISLEPRITLLRVRRLKEVKALTLIKEIRIDRCNFSQKEGTIILIAVEETIEEEIRITEEEAALNENQRAKEMCFLRIHEGFVH